MKRALAKGSMWDAYLQVVLTRELAKGMVARNRGHIINVSSIAGHTPYPGGARSQSWLLECGETLVTGSLIRAFSTCGCNHTLLQAGECPVPHKVLSCCKEGGGHSFFFTLIPVRAIRKS